ncbi:MAG TPA: DUF5615 family PIN-like protein [Gemmataceae bacterium]|jgi:hypothetical protein
MAQLYADENFDYPVVVELRRLGHDVLRAQDAGQGGQGIPDPAVLAFATAAGRAVLTFNHRDFKRLHRQGVTHAGIISCTRDDDSAALASRIHVAILPLPDLDNVFVRITRRP